MVSVLTNRLVVTGEWAALDGPCPLSCLTGVVVAWDVTLSCPYAGQPWNLISWLVRAAGLTRVLHRPAAHSTEDGAAAR